MTNCGQPLFILSLVNDAETTANEVISFVYAFCFSFPFSVKSDFVASYCYPAMTTELTDLIKLCVCQHNALREEGRAKWARQLVPSRCDLPSDALLHTVEDCPGRTGLASKISEKRGKKRVNMHGFIEGICKLGLEIHCGNEALTTFGVFVQPFILLKGYLTDLH